MNKFEVYGYQITTAPVLLDHEYAMPSELKSKIEYYHNMALKGKKTDIPKMLKAIEKYPGSPQLKNYLSVLYGQLGDTKKMYETNHWIVVEHPNYLFGKINLAIEYYENKEFEKIPELLGETMELKALFPEREVFHQSEVMSFLKIAVMYFSAIGKLDDAQMRLDIMEEIDAESNDAHMARKYLFKERMEYVSKRLEEEEKSRIDVVVPEKQYSYSEKAPDFNHKEIEKLYQQGLYMNHDLIDQILSLPRETLIQDLEAVLNDSINRYLFFIELLEEEGWDEEMMNFMVHAFFMLGELKAEESLNLILKVLSYDDEFLEFYFGDFLTADLWEAVYKVGINQLDKLKQFVCSPGISTMPKTLVSRVLQQLYYFQPERQNEVVEWYREVLNFFNNTNLDDNVVDSDAIALIICDVIDIEASVLLPEIKSLYKNGYVSIGICGKFSTVERDIVKPNKYRIKEEILNIKDRYKHITSTWAGYKEAEEDVKEDFVNFNTQEYFKEPESYVRTEPKIGRNEPCPCGSGKKYKRCCGK